MVVDWVTALIGGVVLLLGLGWWRNTYFIRQGVKSPPAYMPFMGHVWNAIIEMDHFHDIMRKIHLCFPEEKYIGTMQFIKPIVTINDVALLKQITIKDFEFFADHTTVASQDDLIFGRGLFALKGSKWREMRATLSPAFTISKVRGMCQFMMECGEQVSEYLLKQMETEENKVRGLVELEMRDVFRRYANDVIATTVFGLSVNSFKEPNNQFYRMGVEGSNFSPLNMFKLILAYALPKRIFKMLPITIMSDSMTNFFRHLVCDTVKDREQRNATRNDLIQILIEAKKGTLKHDNSHSDKEAGFAAVVESEIGKATIKQDWDDDDLVAQALLFFTAGFHSTAGVICFTLHALAMHPEMQKKLHQEIDAVADGLNGNVTYDDLQKMKYLDMVVSESLRMWPSTVGTERRCVRPYTLPPPNEKSTKGYRLNAGDVVIIPIFGFHRDPKLFENPDTFDPERFSEENKGKIVNGSYIPFGLGPRNCIGSRFGLTAAKAAIYSIFRNFDVVPTAKTRHPIQFKRASINLDSKHGFWLGLRPRYNAACARK